MEGLKKLKLFFLKDLTIFFSYKGSILNQLFILFFSAYIIFSLSQIQGIQNLDFLTNSDIDLFSFLFIGLIFTDTSIRVLVSLPAMVRSYQTIGILEELFHISQKKEIEMLFLNSTYTFVLCFFRAAILSLFFFALDGFPSMQQITTSLIIFLLHMTAMCGIGFFCASYSLLFRQNNIIQTFFILGATFFSSAFIPNEAYADFVQNLSIIFPSTSSIEAIRHLYTYGNLDNNLNLLISLFFITALYMIMGVVTFKASVHIAKKYGSLNFF